MTSMRGLIKWFVLIGLGTALFVLGTWGIRKMRSHEDFRDYTLLDEMHAAARLFLLEDIYPPGRKPWQAETARFLAPFVSFSALLMAGLALVGGSFRLMRTRGHTIVCGLGSKGAEFVRDCRERGCTVVAIERDPDGEAVSAAREAGAVVLCGDATDEALLRRARCAHARALVAVCGDDAANVAAALHARAIVGAHRPAGMAEPLKLHLHAGDFRLSASFKSLDAFEGSTDRLDVVPFSFYENCARSALQTCPLDVDPATGKAIAPGEDRRIHLVVAGFAQMGEALALQAAGIGRTANLAAPAITIVDERAKRKETGFRARYPQLDSAAKLDFREADVDDAGVRSRLVELAADPGCLLTIAFCIGHETRALSWGLNLPPEVREAGVRSLVRLPESSFNELVRGRTDLVPFGGLRQGCDLGEERDALARTIHETYRSTKQEVPPWSQLEEGLKDSNRQQADHIPVKLRAVGCEAVARTQAEAAGEFTFTDDEVELLARMEHDRWCAERFLAGWRLGPKDKACRVSPYLIPYDQLEDSIKEYDRIPVRGIPRLLGEGMGMAIRRRPG